MIEFGCLARFFNSYANEIEFAKENGFSFMQIWYDKNGISLLEDVDAKEKIISKFGFPTIIHAVLDINDFEEHVQKLVELAKYLRHREIIIHPICESETITKESIYKLANKVEFALKKFSKEGITLYLENNSRLDPIFNTTSEIEVMFSQNPGLEFLLDIAHIDDYDHLQEMVKIKMPKMLHIADRHLEVIHEHLPIGDGNIDFQYILTEVLPDFRGKVILEIVRENEDIIRAKSIIENLLAK